jgi:uncharacterized protein YoxC
LVRRPTWRNPAWVWAILYSLPTVTFVVMTIYTLLGFVQVVAVSGTPTQATGTALTIRFLAGWSYAMVEILFATLGKKSYTATLDGLRAMVTTQGQELSILKATEQELRATVDRLTSERESHASRAIIATQELQIARESIARLHEEKAMLQQSLEDVTHEVEQLRERVQRAKTRADRKGLTLVPPANQAGIERYHEATHSHEPQATEEHQHTGYVAIDDGHTIAIANGSGATLMATGSHRDRIKEAMQRAIQTGSGINLKAIAEATGTGYSTVKKWKQAILDEIAREQVGEGATVIDSREQS